MAIDQHIRDAALHLGDTLRDRSWFSGVGIAEEMGRPVLMIYLSRRLPKKPAVEIPNVWEDVPVRIQEIGRIAPLKQR